MAMDSIQRKNAPNPIQILNVADFAWPLVRTSTQLSHIRHGTASINSSITATVYIHKSPGAEMKQGKKLNSIETLGPSNIYS